MGRNVLRTFKFKISWRPSNTAGDYTVVGGCTRVSGLRRSQDAIDYRAGEDESNASIKIEGLVKYATVTFERGMALDTEFLKWAEQSSDQATESVDIKKDILVEILDKKGATQKMYVIKNAWPSDLEVTDLDSGASSLVFERISVEHEGFTINKEGTGSESFLV